MGVVDLRGGQSPATNQANEWTVRRVVLATVTVIAVGLGFLLIYRFYFVLFSLIAAIMLHIAVKPAVELLRKRGLRFEVSVVVIYMLLFAFILLFGALLVPMIQHQAMQVVTKLPDYYREFRDFLTNADSEFLRTLGSTLPYQLNGSLGAPPAGGDASAIVVPAWDLVRTVGYSLFVIVSVFMMALQWTLNNERILYRLLLHLPMDRRESARDLIGEIESKVGSYYRGQLILCGFVGILGTIAFTVIGLPDALALGLFAFIFEAVPILGPVLGAAPALLVALGLGLDKVILVTIAIVIIQQIESNVLVPRIMDRTVGVKATVSILAIAAFSLLFGIPGALLAIPLAAIIQIFVNRLLFSNAPPTPPVAAPIAEEAQSEAKADRSRLSLLRLQAQELAQDVRKRQRVESEPTVSADHIEDFIEKIATDLDGILSQGESEQAQPSQFPAAKANNPGGLARQPEKMI